jgi:hypothetical protein
MTHQHQSQSLFNMGVKIAHLPSDIANPHPIQQTQDSAIELS